MRGLLTPRRSVRWKLMGVVLITTAMALLVAGAALLTRDLASYRRTFSGDLATEASILALSTAPALAFDDRLTAVRNLAALRARRGVLAAAIYLADGSLFAEYTRPGAEPPPARLAAMVSQPRIATQSVELTQRVVQNGEWLGTIYLRGRYDVLGRVREYLGILGLVTLMSMVVALILSTALQRVITEPLDAMAAVARHVVTTRDYSPRAQKTTDDEIGILVDAFNSMLDEVHSRTRALEQSNAALKEEVRNREEADAALRESDRRKDEFLATLAHELRNPLAPIRHAVKLLESASPDDRRRKWSQEVISRQVQRMALLLDDLLDVSRITTGRLQLKKEHVELASLVGSSIETARPLIEAKGHSLQVQLPPEPIQLEADPLRLSQALSNLLTNAAKYTDAGGQIHLGVALVEGYLELTVRDTGIGLSARAIPTLFEMFSQVDSAIDRTEGGLGIGLALVKGLVTLHGGSVDAASEGPGRGSTFTIRLPRTLIAQHRPQGAAGATQVKAGGTARCTVLVADDNRDAAESLALVLQHCGYATHVAHTGREALALALRERPEALVLDIGMPEMTGYEVAQHIRREAWGKRALLLAVTGWGQSEDKQRAAAAGFDHHLTKPVAPEALEQLLEQFSLHIQQGRAASGARSDPGLASS